MGPRSIQTIWTNGANETNGANNDRHSTYVADAEVNDMHKHNANECERQTRTTKASEMQTTDSLRWTKTNDPNSQLVQHPSYRRLMPATTVLDPLFAPSRRIRKKGKKTDTTKEISSKDGQVINIEKILLLIPFLLFRSEASIALYTLDRSWQIATEKYLFWMVPTVPTDQEKTRTSQQGLGQHCVTFSDRRPTAHKQRPTIGIRLPAIDRKSRTQARRDEQR